MKVLCSIITMCLLFGGCTMHQKPDKFDFDSSVMKSFYSTDPINIIVPENAGEMLLENINTLGYGSGGTLYYNLDESYKIVKEQIEETLQNNNTPYSSDSSKYIKFTIVKMQWELWGSKFFGGVTGCYLYFDIELSNGYKHSYKVQDQSAIHMDRAVGGSLSRAVEKIFQDDHVINFIEKE